MWLADHLRGKNVLLLAGSNAEAAELSRRVQARLIQLGTVGPPQAALSDGNQAGVGDLIRARLNTKIDAGGRTLTNRDTLKITALRGPDARGAAAAGGRDLDRAVPGAPVLPRTQRRARLRRQCPRRPGPHRRHRAPARHRVAVPAGPVRRHDPGPGGQHRARGHRQDRPGREEALPAGRPRIRARQRPAARRRRPVRHRADPPRPGTGPGAPATCSTCGPPPPGRPCTRTSTSRSRPGSPRPRDGGTTGSTHGRCSSTSCGRLSSPGTTSARSSSGSPPRRWTAPGRSPASCTAASSACTCQGSGHGVTWAQRTPQHAPALAHELAAGLDDRRRELGEQALQNPEPWLTRHLGAPPGPDASPVLREDYAQRAGTAAAYREARGITDPQQAVSLDPHPDPELEALRRDTVRALEIADEQAELRAMSRGELEGQVLQGERAQATAPRDVSSQLRLTAQADADAWQQAADAEAEHDQVRAANARSLAATLAAQASRLEAANARYEEWSARTASTPGDGREGQGRAAAPRPGTGHRGSSRAAEHGGLVAAIRGGRRRPGPRDRARAPGRRPRRPALAARTEAGSRARGSRCRCTRARTAARAALPGIPEAQTGARAGGIQAGNFAATRLPDLSSLTTDAPPGWMSCRPARTRPRAGSTRSGQSLNASSEHTARMEREAQAEPEADRQAETPYEMEMEL